MLFKPRLAGTISRAGQGPERGRDSQENIPREPGRGLGTDWFPPWRFLRRPWFPGPWEFGLGLGLEDFPFPRIPGPKNGGPPRVSRKARGNKGKARAQGPRKNGRFNSHFQERAENLAFGFNKGWKRRGIPGGRTDLGGHEFGWARGVPGFPETEKSSLYFDGLS